MNVKFSDNYLAVVKACGFSNGMASLWRHGKRKPNKAVLFVLRLVEKYGVEAILSGELAIQPNKVAQESSQVPKPKLPRKRKAK